MDKCISKSSILEKDTMKAFDDFKNKQKIAKINAFWHVRVRIF